MVQRIIVNDREVRTLLKTLPTNVQKAVNKAMDKWGIMLQEHMKLGVRQAGIRPWKGKLISSIKWQKSSRGGALWIERYGLALDEMPVHKVSLRKHRKVKQWAKEHNIKPYF